VLTRRKTVGSVVICGGTNNRHRQHDRRQLARSISVRRYPPAPTMGSSSRTMRTW
jgi:hypothetical protein